MSSRWFRPTTVPTILFLTFLLAAFCLAPAPAAFAGDPDVSADGSVNLDDEIEILDRCKTTLDHIGQRVDKDMENNLQSPELLTLRDLVYFTRMAVIELHYYVDLYILSRSRGTGASFRKQKIAELKKKGSDILFDLKKRLQYVSSDIPLKESKLTQKFRSSIQGEMKTAISALEAVEKKLSKAGD